MQSMSNVTVVLAAAGAAGGSNFGLSGRTDGACS